MSLSPNKKQRIGDIKIGYLGSNCSFTCRATKRFFNEYEINNIVNIEYESVHSCQAIFHKVATGQIVYGVVPVESSSHGNYFLTTLISYLIPLIPLISFLIEIIK